MKKHIAIYHTWPELKNAEYEVLARVINAAKTIEVNVTLIDNQGFVVGSTMPEFRGRKSRISAEDCDFAISLHFESPKTIDLYSYYALWNPLEFYFIWGYDRTIRQIITHDDLLSCDSDLADAHALNLYAAAERVPPLPLPRLYHSLAGEVKKPNITSESRAFYIGINWERINSKRGRHHDLLLILDKAGLIDIYGPEEFHGVRPWEGFSCYRGEIPFDGKSTVTRISESGICLAFSSEPHQRSGIMSNRLFEGLAGGALVIVNKHPFIDKHFKDLVFEVDDTQSPQSVVAEVRRIVQWARENPQEANAKAAAAQKVFLARFALEKSLQSIVDGHTARVAQRRSPSEREMTVTAIIVFADLRLPRFEEIIGDLARQTHPVTAVKLIADERWLESNRKKVDAILSEKLRAQYEVAAESIFNYEGTVGREISRAKSLGPAVWKAIQSVETDTFFLIKPEGDLFTNHVESLCATLVRHRAALAAQSGVLVESREGAERFNRRLAYLAAPPEANYYANQVNHAASNLYRSTLREKVNGFVFTLMDGQEHNYLNAAAFRASEIPSSFAVTYSHREWEEDLVVAPLVKVEQQHQYARDGVPPSRKLEVDRRAQLIAQTDVGSAGNLSSAPVRWGGRRASGTGSGVAEMNTRYDICSGGNGRHFLAVGWSNLEADGTWIAGREAIIQFKVGLTPEELAKQKKLTFILELEGRKSEATRRNQHVTIAVNHTPVRYLEVAAKRTAIGRNQNWGTYSVDVPVEVLGGGATVELQFSLDHAEQVFKDGAIVDSRNIGLRVRSLMVRGDP